MRVRCLSDSYAGPNDRRLTIGQEYLVLGLSFEFTPAPFISRPSVHILLENGDVAEGDLTQFAITDPRMSRHWQIRSGRFDGRHFVDICPPELFAMLLIDDRDERTAEEQDMASFEALHSAEFRRICVVLEDEFVSASPSTTAEVLNSE